MLSRSDRLSLLVSRWHALVGLAIPGLLAVSHSEIRDTVHSVTSHAGPCTEDTDTSGLIEEAVPAAAISAPTALITLFENVEHVAAYDHVDGLILTRSERQQLAHDLLRRRVA